MDGPAAGLTTGSLETGSWRGVLFASGAARQAIFPLYSRLSKQRVPEAPMALLACRCAFRRTGKWGTDRNCQPRIGRFASKYGVYCHLFHPLLRFSSQQPQLTYSCALQLRNSAFHYSIWFTLCCSVVTYATPLSAAQVRKIRSSHSLPDPGVRWPTQ